MVFADELDAGSARAARRCNSLAGSALLGGALSMALFNEYISGQVWVEGGQVVGNVTLQHRPGQLQVADQQCSVLPSYRRRTSRVR
jgi:hypothetical protein